MNLFVLKTKLSLNHIIMNDKFIYIRIIVTRHFLRFCYSDKLEHYEYQLTKFQKKTFKIAFMYHSQ